MDARGTVAWSSRPGRLLALLTLGAVLAGLTAAAAWSDARVGFGAATGTLAVGVDTRDGPDGNHPVSITWFSRPFDFGWRVQVLAGVASASRLDAVEPCSAESGVTPAVACRNADVREVRAVFGDGIDTLVLQQPDTDMFACRPGSPRSDPEMTAEVHFGAGNDSLTVIPRACSQGDFDEIELEWVVRVFGQAGNDTLRGGDFSDLLDGGDGNDALTGGGGGDTLQGGAGLDRLIGEAGTDTLRGGQSDDRLEGGEGSDAMLGEADRDTLLGGPGDDLVDGGTGADSIDGGDGGDTLRGGSGNDDLVGGIGRDTIDGGDGLVDSVSYAAETSPVVVTLADTAANDGAVAGGVSERDSVLRVERITGGHVGDSLTGSDGFNILSGGGGDDVLSGLGTHDLVYGGAGNDQLLGGAGDDDLRGDEGADQLTGGTGDDTLVGGPGNDGLKGEGGSDLFVGGAGANLFLARDGESDRFDCALGSDRVDADLLDAVPAGCETVDRYALDDGKPGYATGTRVTPDGSGRIGVIVACPAVARVRCSGVVQLFNPSAPGSALATSGTYTIGLGDSAVVSLPLPATVVSSLATAGSVVVGTQEQGASAAGPRESRRTLAFARA